ncbi:chlorophyllase [Bordetella sp. N]|nr:chlorophyllase [Bordetella sp. N]
MSQQVREADYIPVPDGVPITSFMPLTLAVPGRPVDLQMKVSAPAIGEKLPVMLLSHGLGNSNYLSSMHGYSPLADFYAAHGFVVIQPTHIDSKTLNLRADNPAVITSWKSRANDMQFILDHLQEIAQAVPGLNGRLDPSRIAAVGHSAGGHTVQLLAGMRPTDPATGNEVDLADRRIRAVVMIGAPGGDTDLGPAVQKVFPIARKVNFSEMKIPALIVAGDQDLNPMFSPRVTWRADAYPLSPSPKCQLTLFGAKHSYGGVAQYDAAETTDENPERVSVIQRLSWAYLRTQLYVGDPAWETALSDLAKRADALGKIDCK